MFDFFFILFVFFAIETLSSPDFFLRNTSPLDSIASSGSVKISRNSHIAIAGQNSSMNYKTYVYLYTNQTIVDGLSKFSPPLLDYSYPSINWVDINQDGLEDFYITGITPGVVFSSQIYMRNGAGSYLGVSSNLPKTGYSSTAWFDYDGDGLTDIAITGSDSISSQVSAVYRQVSPGVFVNKTITNVNILYGYSEFVDLNLDGRVDVFISGYDGVSNLVYGLMSLPDGTFSHQLLLSFPDTKIYRIYPVKLDGVSISFFVSGGFNQIYKGSFPVYTKAYDLGNVSDSDVAFYDFNLDGRIDVLIYGYLNSSLFIQNFNGSFIRSENNIFPLGFTSVHPIITPSNMISVGGLVTPIMVITTIQGTSFYKMGCPLGQSFNSSLAVCSPCTGYLSVDSRQCLRCPVGQYVTSSLPSVCAVCPSPEVPSSDQSACIECLDTQFYSSGTGVCLSCPSGKVHSTDSLSCVSCALTSNSYFDFTINGCQGCGAGKISTDGLSCSSCQTGWAASRTGECTECINNQVPNANGSSCVSCASGLIATAGSCQPCPEGQTFSGGECSTSSDSVASIIGGVVGGVGGLGLVLMVCVLCILCILFICLVVVVFIMIISIVVIIMVGVVAVIGAGTGVVAITRKKRQPIQYGDLIFDAKLGEGSFGAVYRGIYKDQEVAIKKINVLMDDKATDDFMKEVEILSSLSHPHVIKYMGMVQGGDASYIVMELAANGSLDKYMTTHHLTVYEKIKICLQIAQALEYLHSKGIVHRDIACRNVLLDDDMNAKITDFGLASADIQDTNTTKVAFGPIRWLPLEFINHKEYSFLTDSHMLGMMIYELLSEKPPYSETPDPIDVVLLIRKGIKPEMDPDWEASIKELITMCWAEKKHRLTMKQIVIDLEEILNTLDEHSSTLSYSPFDQPTRTQSSTSMTSSDVYVNAAELV